MLALFTPVYLAVVAPSLAGYLMHPILVAGQILPHGLCAIVWLPWRARRASYGAIMSALLLLATVAVYGPMLWNADSRGGDMIALAFVAAPAGLSGAVLIGSAVALLMMRLRERFRGASEGTPGRLEP